MLAGTAGFAAAEVAISGYAEIGVIQSEVTGGFAGSNELQFHQDVEVTFKMSGETDGGLSFGAAIDLDETNVALGDDSGTTVFVSGAFGKLTMGDTDGALDWAVQDAGSLTSMGDDHTTHVGYFNANGFDGSQDNQVVRYEYSFGDFGVAVSLEQADNGVPVPATVTDNIAIGATYGLEMSGTKLKLGLGYQSGATAAGVNGEVWGLSVGAEMAAGFSGMIGFTDTTLAGAGNDFSTLGLGVTYVSGPLSVTANYGEIDNEVALDVDSYGVAVNYDLGGGAVVMAGYGSDVDGVAAGNQSQYSIGLGLSF
jgi:outer membrane protein OmpU